MSLVAPLVDGVLQTKTDSGESLTSTNKNNSTVDSDMFLTLLVAEMQNQDPLEPTSNTEWVSQYATFTQVEKMSEMAESMDQLRANSLVGKEVIMKVTSSATGETTHKRGVVEYASIENGKSILVIDGDKYSLSDLDSVISEEYGEAYDLYSEFVAKINALPSLKYIDTSYESTVKELYNELNGMTSYQQNFMKTYAADEISALVEYVARLQEFGIEFEDTSTSESTSATLDDILASFNSKMDLILEKLNSISIAADTTSAAGTTQAADTTSAAGTAQAADTSPATDKTSTTDTSQVIDAAASATDTALVTDAVSTTDTASADAAVSATDTSPATDAADTASDADTGSDGV